MKKIAGEQGSVSAPLIWAVTLGVLFVGTAAFAVWAFMGRQDYKNNSDAKVTAAVTANTQKVQGEDAARYAEEAKEPLKTYIGPDAYGSVHVSYPKTWSAYVEADNSTPLNAYFHSDYVPDVGSDQLYQLRVEVVNRAYDKELARYNNAISKGTVQAAAYSLPEVPDVVGTRLSGAIVPNNQSAVGNLVLLPLRDKTLAVWTESNEFLKDFETHVLPHVTFSP